MESPEHIHIHIYDTMIESTDWDHIGLGITQKLWEGKAGPKGCLGESFKKTSDQKKTSEWLTIVVSVSKMRT